MTGFAGVGRPCSVCSLDDDTRQSVDLMLVEQVSLATIAAQTGTKPTSLRRHRDRHLVGEFAYAHEDQQTERIVDQLRDIATRAHDLSDAAEDANQPAVALQAATTEARVLAILAAAGAKNNGDEQFTRSSVAVMRAVVRAGRRDPDAVVAVLDQLDQVSEHTIRQFITDAINPNRKSIAA